MFFFYESDTKLNISLLTDLQYLETQSGLCEYIEKDLHWSIMLITRSTRWFSFSIDLNIYFKYHQHDLKSSWFLLIFKTGREKVWLRYIVIEPHDVIISWRDHVIKVNQCTNCRTQTPHRWIFPYVFFVTTMHKRDELLCTGGATHFIVMVWKNIFRAQMTVYCHLSSGDIPSELSMKL